MPEAHEQIQQHEHHRHHISLVHFVICAGVLAVGLGSAFLEKQAYARIYEKGPERIYQENIEHYFSQDSYYVELADNFGENLFGELQKRGIILSYTQPFASLDLPYFRIQFLPTKKKQIEQLLDLMKRNNQITSTEQVPLYKIQGTAAGSQLVTQSPQRYMKQIGLTQKQVDCLTFDNPKTRVAIIDNAFLIHHPNIIGQIKETIDIADRDADIVPPEQTPGWDHGTMSVGLVAGIPKEQRGILGTALGNADIIAIKATEDTANSEYITHGIEGVQAAIKAGADIIVLSRGSPKDSQIFRKVIDKATQKGIQIIAAAGNQGDSQNFYPAAYDDVVSIGSYDQTKKRASFSNYGLRVDIYAPGTDLMVPSLDDTYALSEGTSLSAPLYAGAYALLYRYFGHKNYLQSFLQTSENIIEQKPTLKMYDICGTKNRLEDTASPSKSASIASTGTQYTSGFVTQTTKPSSEVTRRIKLIEKIEQYRTELWYLVGYLFVLLVIVKLFQTTGTDTSSPTRR